MRRIWAAMAAVMIGLALGSARAGWFTDERPPLDAKKLSEVIQAVEARGLGAITEIEFDDGVWKIELHGADGTEINLKVDPMSGEIRSGLPAGAAR